MNIIEAIESDKIFRGLFRDLGTWANWITFLKVLFNLPLDRKELRVFRKCTGRRKPPKEPIKECWICAGRRSGKSTACSLLAVFFAIWGDWEQYLSPGEKAYVFIVATNLDQAKIIKGYVSAIFDLNSFFRNQVRRETTSEIELKNGAIISIKPASWRTTRGFSAGILIMEELAFWRYETESAIPDVEVYNAVLPAMSTIKNSLRIGISTPFARQGLLYEKFQKHWSKPGNVLCWKAPTWVMNLSLSEKEIEQEFREPLGDSAYFSEYACAWREDIESFLPVHVIEHSIVKERRNIPYSKEHSYYAFCDPSEGMQKSGDSMTLAIAHAEKTDDGKKYVVDRLDEAKPPFDNKKVIELFASNLKYYGISKVVQDKHAIGWIESDFRKYDIMVEVADKTKSEIYDHFGVMMNKRECELLDIPKLKNESIGLERRLKSGGVSKVNHRANAHDDLINSVAGVCVLCKEQSEIEPLPPISFGIVEPPALSSDEELERYARKWLLDDKKPVDHGRLGKEIDSDGNVIEGSDDDF